MLSTTCAGTAVAGSRSWQPTPACAPCSTWPASTGISRSTRRARTRWPRPPRLSPSEGGAATRAGRAQPSIPHALRLRRLQAAEQRNDAVQRRSELLELAGQRAQLAAERVGQPAQEITEQATTALGGDVEHDRLVRGCPAAERDPKPEEVEVDRAEHQVQDRAASGLAGLRRARVARQRRRHQDVSALDVAAVQPACQRASGPNLAVLDDEAIDGVRAGELLPVLGNAAERHLVERPCISHLR